MRNKAQVPILFVGLLLIGTLALASIACGQDSVSDEGTESEAHVSPDASPAQPGDVALPNLPKAPDFTLPAANQNNAAISLSSFQGEKEVVLVFYRAYW